MTSIDDMERSEHWGILADTLEEHRNTLRDSAEAETLTEDLKDRISAEFIT